MTDEKVKSLFLIRRIQKICYGVDFDVILEALLTFTSQIISENYEENADIPFSEALLDCIKIRRE